MLRRLPRRVHRANRCCGSSPKRCHHWIKRRCGGGGGKRRGVKGGLGRHTGEERVALAQRDGSRMEGEESVVWEREKVTHGESRLWVLSCGKEHGRVRSLMHDSNFSLQPLDLILIGFETLILMETQWLTPSAGVFFG